MPKHVKKTIRILLSEAASRALDQTGCRAFAIVGKDTSGDHPGRWVIYLRDASHLEAQDAQDVLLGRKIAVPISKSNTNETPPSNDSTAEVLSPGELLSSQPERSEPPSTEKTNWILATTRDDKQRKKVCRNPHGDRSQDQERDRSAKEERRDPSRSAGSESGVAENPQVIAAANGFWNVQIKYGETPGNGAGTITLHLDTTDEAEARELAAVVTAAFRKAVTLANRKP